MTDAFNESVSLTRPLVLDGVQILNEIVKGYFAK